MSIADTDALTERLWDAVAEVRDQHPRVFNDAPTDEVVAAVLPIVAEEVRKAKAEALRDAAPLMHDHHDAAWLETQAIEYETGASDEHR